jgi:hypothetical protein
MAISHPVNVELQLIVMGHKLFSGFLEKEAVHGF